MPSESAASKLISSSGGNWADFSFKFPGADAVASVVSEITGAIGTSLSIQKSILEILVALSTDILNLEATLVKAALDTVTNTIEEFLVDDAKIHALIVPPRKQLPAHLASDSTPPSLETSWEINDKIDEGTKRRFETIVKEAAQYDQGNYGFARTVIESLDDDTDLQRPQYGKNAAVFSIVVVAGAQSFVALYDLLSKLQKAFSAGLKSDSLIPPEVVKTPQNVRPTLIAAPEKTSTAVCLQWENPPVVQTIAGFNNTRVRIDEVSIVRGNNDKLATATTWGDVFADAQPTALEEVEKIAENLLEVGETKIIKTFAYDGIRNAYIDDDPDLEKDKDYYYFIAYRYSLSEPPPPEKSELDYQQQAYQQISNVVKVRLEDGAETPSSKKGVKPDWHTHTSILDMFPDFKKFLIQIKHFVSGFASYASGVNTAMQSYIDFIDAEATRYLNYAEQLNTLAANLTGLDPAAGLYFTVIDSSEGGVEFFKQEVMRRLSDESDSTAPPFFKSGVTAGVVLFAGAPNPANLQSVKDLAALLTADTQQTAFQNAVNTIDRVVTALEDRLTDDDFADNMVLLPEDIVVDTSQDTPYNTFDDAMNPVDADDAEANVPFDP